ncbi:MAG: RNA ligase family protein [Pseudomonadota bacterium]
MTPDKFTKYPHIENIDEVPAIFELPEVIVTEKVHGSAMRIGLIDGHLRYGGRKLEFNDIRPESKEGQGFISWMLATGLDKKIKTAFIGHDVILFGEWHGSGTPSKGWPQIQKGICYIKGNDFRVFDVRLDGKYLSQDEVLVWAAKVGLKTMPVLFRGRPDGEVFNSLIDTMSRVGEENGIVDAENTIEGIVIRPTEMQWDVKGNPIMAKYKVGRWAERASAASHPRTPPKERPVIPGAKEFAHEFVTPMRLNHVLDQLRENGIPIDIKSLGEVMKRMGQDIKREGANALADARLDWKDVSPFVTHLTKNLFSQYLREGEKT